MWTSTGLIITLEFIQKKNARMLLERITFRTRKKSYKMKQCFFSLVLFLIFFSVKECYNIFFCVTFKICVFLNFVMDKKKWSFSVKMGIQNILVTDENANFDLLWIGIWLMHHFVSCLPVGCTVWCTVCTVTAVSDRSCVWVRVWSGVWCIWVWWGCGIWVWWSCGIWVWWRCISLNNWWSHVSLGNYKQ